MRDRSDPSNRCERAGRQRLLTPGHGSSGPVLSTPRAVALAALATSLPMPPPPLDRGLASPRAPPLLLTSAAAPASARCTDCGPRPLPPLLPHRRSPTPPTNDPRRPAPSPSARSALPSLTDPPWIPPPTPPPPRQPHTPLPPRRALTAPPPRSLLPAHLHLIHPTPPGPPRAPLPPPPACPDTPATPTPPAPHLTTPEPAAPPPSPPPLAPPQPPSTGRCN